MNPAFRSLPLIQNEPIHLCEDRIVKCGRFEQLKRFLLPGYDKQEIQAIADYLLKNLQDTQKGDANLLLANAFVNRFEKTLNGDKISQIFDRAVAQFRQQKNFFHIGNKKNMVRWVRYGQDISIYKNHPEFCTFMETSGLLSQIKVTRDKFIEIDGEPALKVTGRWIKWSDFKNQFKAVYSARYNETFIVHQDNQVYTYLDNGKGLQLHHPFLSERTPTSILNNQEYEKVLEKAQTFVRPGEENLNMEESSRIKEQRIFIIQVITSSMKGPDTRFHELIINSKHPYARLIIGRDNPGFNTSKGEVYEVGYGWKNKLTAPLSNSQGRFRSPDVWEYKNCEEKIVTNIAVTAEEAQAFVHYVSEYHRSEVNIGNPIGFHLFKQNCSTFIRAALDAANIKVPTETTLSALWFDVLPLWIVKTNEQIKAAASTALSLAKYSIKILPSWIKTPLKKAAGKIGDAAKKALDTVTAVVFIPLKIALGDAFGSGGKAFVKAGDKPQDIKPEFKQYKRWPTLSKYTVNLPGILQRWQRKQLSTVIYKKPVKLCIVP